eukprot:5481489-Amphidinium_carterae.1
MQLHLVTLRCHPLIKLCSLANRRMMQKLTAEALASPRQEHQRIIEPQSLNKRVIVLLSESLLCHMPALQEMAFSRSDTIFSPLEHTDKMSFVVAGACLGTQASHRLLTTELLTGSNSLPCI